jgi:tetratricopeptide (TPR) repeat protein
MLAGESTNSPAPVTPRDLYNAGTKLLAAKKFAGAEQMFQSALATQDARVQPPVLYNLGQTRFAEGADLLKQGPDAQKISTQGNAAIHAGENVIRSAESVLVEGNLQKMVAAYLEGRGVRRNLRDAEKTVQAAMGTYGKTLQQWRRAADDFKGAAELNPADTNATSNAEIVERHIARLVDSLREMQQMAAGVGDQKQKLDQTLGKLKGQIPASAMPLGGGGADEEDVQPESLAGQKEGTTRDGGEMQIQISPDMAREILGGISLDGARRLMMSDQQGTPPGERKGRNW